VQKLIRTARPVIETLTQSLALSYTICGGALEFSNRPSLLHVIGQAQNRCVAAAIISIHIKSSASNLPFWMHHLSNVFRVSVDDLPELEARLLNVAYSLNEP